ncbi:Fpg/Nei family DNA glycosylase [Terrabacter aerolatus]|uniref:DNA-(apurinic or apyrimidinic site) lyase n=1 Tax=Terrabacter aerolatus TaxID=422442 RepID=A0A512D2M3_9MICO|nr:DNA-formamidopyrimidine glycosylase family protein [Terrabacter aerolatus]GEO30722.1 endonuclease VIII [Terrabacter aerolatus]
MPEGHTIHALADRLERAFRGHEIAASSPQGRFAAEAERLDGHVLERAQAWGKHLFVSIGDATLHVHLGLIGMFPVKHLVDGVPPAPVGAVRLRIVGPEHVADLRGAMICTLVDAGRQREIVAALGPDPLRRGQRPDGGWARVRRSRRALAELLMDQSVLAGVGNVYRCEVLHRLAVDPLTRGIDVSQQVWQEIWDDLVRLMPLGRTFSQIITTPDQVEDAERARRTGRGRQISRRLTGERLGDTFERRFLVYKRTGQPCPRCSQPVRESEIAGRRLYWCPACQLRH